MMFNRSAKKKMSFARFLSYEYADDYINQTTPYAGQIEQAARAVSYTHLTLPTILLV